jgi:hypothetical protein
MEVLKLDLSDRPLIELENEQSKSYLLHILVIISVISIIGAITFLLFKKRTYNKEE